MARMFNNRSTDIFSGAELLDMFEGFRYRAPNIASTYEAYLDYVDRVLAARLNKSDGSDGNLNAATDMKNPNFMLRKVLCFDIDEYDHRVGEIRYESQLLKKADKVIQKYSQ